MLGVRAPVEVPEDIVERESSTGKSVPLLMLRADPDEREALLSVGYPFFVPRRAGRDRIGCFSPTTRTGRRSESS
jgi:hypothetical protein